MARKLHNRNKTPICNAFGLKVRLHRHEMEITQEEFAEKTELHPTYIGSVERVVGRLSGDGSCITA